MTLLIILLVLGALDLCWFLYGRVKEKSTKAAMIKSSVSVLFMSVAAVAWSLIPDGAAHAKFAPFLLIGLLCGLLGDIWLDLKFVYRKKTTSIPSRGSTPSRPVTSSLSSVSSGSMAQAYPSCISSCRSSLRARSAPATWPWPRS